ncbi:hypothetical protein [Neorhizobium petrolearium]|uniref:hypothetical protein n=1 Tax=Neorhizobium petrolearium TaxID=515361 RepID=UPI003F7F5A75
MNEADRISSKEAGELFRRAQEFADLVRNSKMVPISEDLRNHADYFEDIARSFADERSGLDLKDLREEAERFFAVISSSGSFTSGRREAVEANFKTIIERIAGYEARAETLAPLVDLMNPAPEQRIAPYQFRSEDGRVVAFSPTVPPAAGHETIAEASGSALLEQCSELLADLEGSNYDRRLMRNLKAIQGNLLNGDNVIGLGIRNVSLLNVVGTLAEELPGGLLGALQGLAFGIRAHLAQFPDWIKFSQAAYATPIDPGSTDAVSKLSREIAAALDAREDVDQSVPAALTEAADRAADGEEPRSGLVKTVENLMAFAYRELVVETGKELAVVGRTAAVITILHIALAYSAPLLKVPGLEWIAPAAAVLRKKVDEETKE